MQLFEWFEEMILRLKNHRTRKRAIINLSLFAFIVGFASLVIVYSSTYTKSRAEFDAKSLGPPSIRFEYHSFSGSSAIYAVSKKGMAFSELKGFEMGARWWKNDVLVAAEALVDSLGIRPEYSNQLPNSALNASVIDKTGKELHTETHYSYDREAGALTDRIAKLFKTNPAKKFFNLPTTHRKPYPNENIEQMLLLALISPNLRIQVPPATLAESTGKAFSFDEYSVSGFAPMTKVAGRTGDKWTEIVFRKNPQFYDLVKYSAFFLHDSPVATFEPRELRLLALSIENIGDQPVFSPQLLIRRVAGSIDGVLRTEKSQEATLRNSKPETSLMPLDALKPGERLYIPLALYMEFRTDRVEEFPDWKTYASNDATFSILVNTSPQGAPNSRTLTLDISSLKNRTSKPPLQNRRYYFGPTVEPITLSVERPGSSEIQVRKYDPLNIILADGDEKGSCPILYVGNGSAAVRLRPVLVNAVTQARGAKDAVKVSATSNEFELRELEPERSFIRSARMIIQLRGGTEISYEPDFEPARRIGEYLLLDQGESWRLRFKPSHDLTLELSRRIEIEGYYVPYSIMAKS